MAAKNLAPFNVYPTVDEKAFIEEAAKRDRRSVSAFIVTAAIAAAERTLGRKYEPPAEESTQ